MGKPYLNRTEQDILYKLGAISSTLDEIYQELKQAGKPTKWIKSSHTFVEKQIGDMTDPLPNERFAEYLERIKRRKIYIDG